MFDKYMFSPRIATILKSVDKAFILEYIDWSIRHKEQSKHDAYREFFHEGKYWMRDNMSAWVRRMPWSSRAKIERLLKDLRQKDLIECVKIHQTFGDQTNYYRVHRVNVAALAESLEGIHRPQNEVSESLKMRECTVPQNEGMFLYRTKNPNTLKKETYQNDHQFSRVFDNLRKLVIANRKFVVKDYMAWLTELVTEFNLTVSDLEKLSNEWQEYHNDATQKPKSPKGSFRTWVKKYAQHRESTKSFQSRSKPTTKLAAVGNDDDQYSDGW